ncbi:MAG: exopolysaccharide Pel transporter PelG [Spirochaetes bacterium]|nr:exopolysaccharide Pel transporter PelG [Spirochaetota bacterium]
MAGIGFQLHKLIEDESFFNKAKAYIFASIITSGPWILSIICLALLGALSGKFLQGERFTVISITIVYTFAFSLILTGPLQFTLTRYLADKEYLKQKEKMLSALITALIISTIVALTASVWWYYYIEHTLLYKIISVSLFTIICAIWTMMDFLSCLKNYGKIIISFFFGTLVSIIAASVLGNFFRIEGALGGYTLGQLFIFSMLLFYIMREFKFNGIINPEFLRYFRLVPFIFFTGLFYNLGLWTDKLFGWIFYGENVFSNFRSFSAYDTPVFIAYLCIIPSLAYFLIQSETRFYIAYRNFFDSISQEDLHTILNYKEQLTSTLKSSLAKLFIIQFIASLLGFIFSEIIAEWSGITGGSVLTLRILFFAAGMQVMFLYIIIFLMYFDLSRISFYVVLMFFILNLCFNFYSYINPILPMGTAYLLAIGLTSLTGFILLLYSVSDIEYSIFMRQEN